MKVTTGPERPGDKLVRASCFADIVYCSRCDPLLFSRPERMHYVSALCLPLFFTNHGDNQMREPWKHRANVELVHGTSSYAVVYFHTLVSALVFWRRADTRGRPPEIMEVWFLHEYLDTKDVGVWGILASQRVPDLHLACCATCLTCGQTYSPEEFPRVCPSGSGIFFFCSSSFGGFQICATKNNMVVLKKGYFEHSDTLRCIWQPETRDTKTISIYIFISMNCLFKYTQYPTEESYCF